MPSIIDVRGGGAALIGRLRGVTARHEIRPVLDVGNEHIYFEPHDAHFVFRSAVPDPLPDALTNTCTASCGRHARSWSTRARCPIPHVC